MRLLHNDASCKSQALVTKIVEKMDGLNKSRKEFIVYILMLYLSMRGRYTFEGMSRYGKHCEKTHRLQFEKDFDFLSFNTALCKATLSNHRIIAFDPSYLPKSGKHTPHRDTFWSGCLGKAVKGLEIGGFAVIDVENNTALSLEAVQTPPSYPSTTGSKPNRSLWTTVYRSSREAGSFKFVCSSGWLFC